jgi:hypothetical protein
VLQEKPTRVAVDDFLDEFCVSTPATSNDELERYLAEPVAQVSFMEILNWWKINSVRYPKLADVAKKFLAVPATSASSESAFRYGGLTITELRNRLSPDLVSDLLFVRHFNTSA